MINVALKSRLVKLLANNLKTVMARRMGVVCAKLDALMVSVVASSERYAFPCCLLRQCFLREDRSQRQRRSWSEACERSRPRRELKCMMGRDCGLGGTAKRTHAWF